MKSFFTQAVNEYYVDIFRENFRRNAARIRALKNPVEAESYRHAVRNRIRRGFALPTHDQVPPCTECGVIRHDGFLIRKLICEVRPGDFVPANLYLPDRRNGKVPGVLFLCGHAEDGKACATYRLCCTALALNGCAVLTFDPSGQGERQLYGGDMKRFSVWQHNMIARQMDLTGISYSTWCLYDAVRMLDVLCALPEVDSGRIGVTGNSGGGNMSAFLSAVDDRPAAVAPSCYLTSWRHNIENELPCCAEQEPPGLPGAGCEMSDLLIASAPRPHLILGQKNDFFDPRGTAETFEIVKKFYALLGKKENIECFIGPYGHGYFDSNRAAMYGFFARHLGFELRVPEPECAPPDTEKDLSCTVGGNVYELTGARHPREFAAEKAARLAARRKRTPWERRKAGLGKLLEIDRAAVPYFRVLRIYRPDGKGTAFARFGLETEKNRVMAVLYRPYNGLTCFHPECSGRVELFVPHRDALTEFSGLEQGTCERWAVDMRGTGAITPGSCDAGTWTGEPEFHAEQPQELNICDHMGRNAFGYYNYDYHFWACGNMLGRPFAGGRVRDVLSAMKLLAANGAEHIELVAGGQGILPAALAALFFRDCTVSFRMLDDPLSFDEIMKRNVVPLPHSGLITGILKYLDFPELLERIGASR